MSLEGCKADNVALRVFFALGSRGGREVHHPIGTFASIGVLILALASGRSVYRANYLCRMARNGILGV
jgi:hypothetical protein